MSDCSKIQETPLSMNDGSTQINISYLFFPKIGRAFGLLNCLAGSDQLRAPHGFRDLSTMMLSNVAS